MNYVELKIVKTFILSGIENADKVATAFEEGKRKVVYPVEQRKLIVRFQEAKERSLAFVEDFSALDRKRDVLNRLMIISEPSASVNAIVFGLKVSIRISIKITKGVKESVQDHARLIAGGKVKPIVPCESDGNWGSLVLVLVVGSKKDKSKD